MPETTAADTAPVETVQPSVDVPPAPPPVEVTADEETETATDIDVAVADVPPPLPDVPPPPGLVPPPPADLPTPVAAPTVAPVPTAPGEAVAPPPSVPALPVGTAQAPQTIPTPPPAAPDPADPAGAVDPTATPPAAVAAIDPLAVTAAPDNLSLPFDTNTAVLGETVQAQLDAIANRLEGGTERLQIRAFATDPSGRTSAARRLSLSRALAVRGYLLEKGIDRDRIDVRALGVPDDGSAADRVDLAFIAIR